MMRRFSVANAVFVTCAIVGFLSACSGSSTTPSQPFCPVSKPFVELLYPIPNSTGVSTNVGQMVFASNGIARIRLEIGPYPFSGTLRTTAEPVPNPLPTPIATAGPYAQYLTTRFAVSFVTLQPQTQYNAQAYVVPNPCSGGESFPPGWSNIGSFTTQ